MIGFLIPGWLKRAALAVAALALALFGARWSGKREGQSQARAKAAEDAIKRTDKGREAAAKAKDRIAAGKEPDEIVQGNDRKW